VIYRTFIKKQDPDRQLYLAIRNEVFLSLFAEPVGKELIEAEKLSLLVFDSEQEVIAKWID
jgi:hypothetical protein